MTEKASDQTGRAIVGTARRINSILNSLALTTGALCVAMFSVAVIYIVFARFFLSQTPAWAEELPRLLLVWLTFVGALSGFAKSSHFRAGIIPMIVSSPMLRRIILFITTCSTIAFLATLAYTGWQMTMLTWSNQTPALGLSVGLFYLALPVCCSISVLAELCNLASNDSSSIDTAIQLAD